MWIANAYEKLGIPIGYVRAGNIVYKTTYADTFACPRCKTTVIGGLGNFTHLEIPLPAQEWVAVKLDEDSEMPPIIVREWRNDQYVS